MVAGGLHSDLVVPTEWVTLYGANIPDDLQDFKYLSMGWGDYVAYTTRWKAKDLVKAFFVPSQSILQIVGFNKEPERTFSQRTVVPVAVPSSRGPEIASVINDTMEMGEDGRPIIIRPAKWGTGHFIASPHRYYYPRMCNQWVSHVLSSAGVDTAKSHPFMTAQTVLKQIDKFERQQSLEVADSVQQ